MAQRTQGDVAIFRDHPNAETRASLAEIRRISSERNDALNIADLYCAKAGTEQEANAKFLVKAWNSHDQLVAALRTIKSQSIGPDWTPDQAIAFIKQHAAEVLESIDAA